MNLTDIQIVTYCLLLMSVLFVKISSEKQDGGHRLPVESKMADTLLPV